MNESSLIIMQQVKTSRTQPFSVDYETRNNAFNKESIASGVGVIRTVTVHDH